MVFVSKETFFDMLDKKVMDKNFKQWNITSKHKKSRRKKRYVSEDVYEIYLKIKNAERA